MVMKNGCENEGKGMKSSIRGPLSLKSHISTVNAYDLAV